MLKKYNSFHLTIYWIIVAIAIGLISGLIVNSNASGGEQKLFTYLAYSIAISLIGGILINTWVLLFIPGRSAKDRLLSLCFIIVSLIFLYPLFNGVVIGSTYDIVEKTRYIGADKIDIKIEYYPSVDTSRVVRSESFWKNGKKDSVWITYKKDGGVLKRLRYNNDELIESTK